MDVDGEAGVAGVEGSVEDVGLVGVLEGEARCINLSALTRPLREVTVADRPGGADMEDDCACNRGPQTMGRLQCK